MNKRSPITGRLLSGLLSLLLAGGALFLSPGSLRAADGRDLLARTGVTAVERNFSGSKVVIDFSQLTPQVAKLSVLRQLDGKERRVYQTSKSVVVIDGDYFYQYHPAKRLLIKKKLPGEGGYDSLQKENLKQTLVSYELRNLPSEAVAGRDTLLYEFHPRDAGTRPMRKVWVDIETGLFLRMEIYSPGNKLFWLSAYEDIDYQATVSPASFTMEVPSGVRVVETEEGRCFSPGTAAEIAGFPLGLPQYLPGGFVRKCVRARHSGDYGEIQVLYSDGLSLLSIFESTRFRPLKESGSSQSAPVQVDGSPGSLQGLGLVSALSWKSPWAYVTILGEISRDEMLKVAESIRPLRELSRP